MLTNSESQTSQLGRIKSKSHRIIISTKAENNATIATEQIRIIIGDLYTGPKSYTKIKSFFVFCL